MLGKQHTEASKIKISDGNKGKHRRVLSKEEIERRTKTRIKNGWNKQPKKDFGDKHWNWKGGISKSKRYARYWSALYKFRKKGAGGHFTLGEWENLKIQYNWTCPSCQLKEPSILLTMDHIVPITRDGSNNIENIQPLCRICNSKKHTNITKFDISK